MSVRLFVGNLPYKATEAELREHFSTVGEVSYLSVPTDRETGQPRGFAFVEFNDRSQAEKAIRELNNQPFKGRPLAVSEARAREDRPPGGSNRTFSPRPGYVSGQSANNQEAGVSAASPQPAGTKRSRNFGPDASPSRRHKGQGGSRPERGPKGPMREMVRSQFFGDDEDEGGSYDDDADNLLSNDDDVASQDSDKENVDDSQRNSEEESDPIGKIKIIEAS